MDGKILGAMLLLASLGLGAAQAQDNAAAGSAKELDAIRAQLKSQEEKIERLSQEVARLTEGLRQKGVTAVATPLPLTTPSPAAAAPATAGVENATPAEAPNSKTHTVAKGETLTQIAKQFGVTVEDIKQLNKIEDAKKLQAGQTIRIPPPANPSPAANP